MASSAAAVPGLRSQHAVVGWLARTEAVASVFGVATVENDRVTVRQSPPVQWSAPIARQRLGVWAHALDRMELAAVVVGDGVPPNYTLAKFGLTPERPEGELRTQPLEVKAGQLASAAIDYACGSLVPVECVVLLTSDGQLLDEYGRPIRQSVSPDSVLPIALSQRGRFWGKAAPDGTLVFEDL
jgi:hypothetical protein